MTWAADGNRLTYLDSRDPFYVHGAFPKLTTPQWVGEEGVEAVVVMAIDDMRDPKRYEAFLRPLLNRLKEIDGRAPVSIFCNALDPSQPQLQAWLKEGLSFEVHTLSHPCPLLGKSNFVAAVDTYNGCIDLLNRIPGSKPVGFRMPCCDSINSPSPRFYSEIFTRPNSAGQFLTLDSSVMNIFTTNDPSIPREMVMDADGREKYRKYLPFPSFVTTIENYPYPYVINGSCWEFPAMVPSDWEAQHIHGTNNPVTVADWKTALDITVRKQGTFSFIFHPHGWIRPDQLADFVDYAAKTYGRKVKFLTFREAQERLDRHLLKGQPLRSVAGRENGIRLLDLNGDGFLDVAIGNEQVRLTRIWDASANVWKEAAFPSVISGNNGGISGRFAIRKSGQVEFVRADERVRGAWQFDSGKWVENKLFFEGLHRENITTSRAGKDSGLRFRDFDGDGADELLISNPAQNAIYRWSEKVAAWEQAVFVWPDSVTLVDENGLDNGVRFVDVNEDGYDDLICSNARRYSFHLFMPKLFLGFQPGWSRAVLSGDRKEAGGIPMIVRGDAERRDNGVWFKAKHLWVQNEETAHLPDLVDRRSFADLMGGLQPAAKTPEASRDAMRVRPGFEVQLVAQEPLVVSPVAMEWGADGKLWVVTMADYPLGMDGQGKPGGTIRFLEDTNHDGRYDKSTIFLENVNFPTGVMPWRKGVIVSAAPEIFYAEDTDGDGHADVRKVLFSGFREGNQQHRVNGFEYGLDHWLYGANGDSGGQVRAASGSSAIQLQGHDFRIRPDELLIETVTGQTQFGRHRDDWGNWFGNNNPTWLWHDFVDEKYLARNPNLPVRNVKKYLANYPDSTRAYAISQTMQRFNDIGMVNHVTSGNSPTPYRDELFGPEYASSVFISEPVHNVVHREVLEQDGISFTSHRAAGEENVEFLASTDNWFRPTMLKTGPDGALYIADMYRLVLEHPEWIPLDAQKQFDLRAGADKGRIYRVVPKGAALRAIPRLDRMSEPELVASLNSVNGWERDTAQRLLIEKGSKSAAASLESLARSGRTAKSRIQALWTLRGLSALSPETVLAALTDPDAHVREHAIKLSEDFASRGGLPASMASNLEQTLAKLAGDPNLRVRYQLAFTMGEWKTEAAGVGLLHLARQNSTEENMRTAIASSIVSHHAFLLDALLGTTSPLPECDWLLAQLIRHTASAKDRAALEKVAARISAPSATGFREWQFLALNDLLDAVERQGLSFERAGQEKIESMLAQGRRIVDAFPPAAADAAATQDQIKWVLPILGRSRTEQDADLERIARFLQPQQPDALQQAALGALQRLSRPAVAGTMLRGWKSCSPSVQNSILAALLTRFEWTTQLLDKIEAKEIQPSELNVPARQKLLTHQNGRIRDRAAKLFAEISADREKVLRSFDKVAELDGNEKAGAAQFRQNCATCHRFKGEGFQVGPDLEMVAGKPARVLVASILNPNDAFETRYTGYTLVTKTGRELSGILEAETSNSVTLKNAGGLNEVVLRSDIQALNSQGRSLMPAGLESALSPQDLADVIAYLRSR